MDASPPTGALLSVLPPKLAQALFGQARAVELAPQQTLFTAGDPGDGFYLVDEGLLKVNVISVAGSERILAILGPGDLLGELSVIDGAPRSASVIAIRESKLRFVSSAVFEAVADASPNSIATSPCCCREGCAPSTTCSPRRAFCPSKGGLPARC